MMPDFISQVIEDHYEYGFHTSCSNCERLYTRNFTNGYLCSGIVKYPKRKLPFDIIRLCDSNERHTDYFDYAPNEALLISEILTLVTRRWMENTISYKKFRKIENYGIKKTIQYENRFL